MPVLSVHSHSLKNGIWKKVSIYFHDSNQSKKNPEQLRNKAKMSHICCVCWLIYSVLNIPRHRVFEFKMPWLSEGPTVWGQADRNGERSFARTVFKTRHCTQLNNEPPAAPQAVFFTSINNKFTGLFHLEDFIKKKKIDKKKDPTSAVNILFSTNTPLY